MTGPHKSDPGCDRGQDSKKLVRSEPKCIVLTGASGFVGSHAAERFIQRGYQVTCLVRPSSSLHWLAGLDLRIEIVDFEDASNLRAVLAGQQVLVHMAGAVKAEGAETFDLVNLDLTRRMLRAAMETRNGPRRFVFLSSLAAAGPTGERAERLGLAHRPVSAYGRSKLAAEKVLLERKQDIDVVILRPTAVYGPRDRAMLSVFRAAALGLALAPAGGRQLVSFCHVADLADSILLATTGEVPSGSILPIASTGAVSARRFNRFLLDAVRSVVGRRLPGLSLPLPPIFLRGAGTIGSVWSHIMGRSVMLDRDKAMELTAGNWVVDPGPAARLLGFSASWSLRNGLEQTAAWYRREGWL